MTDNIGKLVEYFAGKITNHGAHIKRHVAYIWNHDQSFCVVRLILCWIKGKASSGYGCRILLSMQENKYPILEIISMVYLNKHINKLLIPFTKVLVFPFLTIHDTNNLYLSVLIPFLYQLFFLFTPKIRL